MQKDPGEGNVGGFAGMNWGVCGAQEEEQWEVRLAKYLQSMEVHGDQRKKLGLDPEGTGEPWEHSEQGSDAI